MSPTQRLQLVQRVTDEKKAKGGDKKAKAELFQHFKLNIVSFLSH